MAIFSRRANDRMMRENARFLSEEQIKKFARKLNKADEESLGFEWEVAVLNALGKIGVVEYEKPLGTRRPDVHLTSRASPNQVLIADITTVSDIGLEMEKLVRLFAKRLRVASGKRRLDVGHFSYRFQRIPDGAKLTDFFNTELGAFLDAVAGGSRTPATYESSNKLFAMSYDPQQSSYTQSSPVTEVTSLTRNPFCNALENKRDQLREAVFTGPRGIILCNGESNMFFFRKGDVLSYGSDQVIRDFLRRRSDINFVLTVNVDRTPDPTQPVRLHRVRTQLFPNSNFEEVAEDVRRGLADLERLFPLAVVTVETALGHIQKGDGKVGWAPHYWRLTVSEDGRRIKISGRALLDLLAGDIRHEEFIEGLELERQEDSTQSGANPFLQRLRAGELISDIRLEGSELDDDYVVITFGEADPAVSSYKVSDGSA